MTQRWHNRIVGYATKPASAFLANPRNWRLHPQHQQDALAGVLDEVGWVQNVIENVRTGNLIDGHLRISLALRRGDTTPIPVTLVDLDEAEEAKILATLDPIAALAAADATQLDELLREVDTESAAVTQMLSQLAADAGITPLDAPGPDATRACVIPEQFLVIVACRDEATQIALINQLTQEGHQCRALVS